MKFGHFVLCFWYRLPVVFLLWSGQSLLVLGWRSFPYGNVPILAYVHRDLHKKDPTAQSAPDTFCNGDVWLAMQAAYRGRSSLFIPIYNSSLYQCNNIVIGTYMCVSRAVLCSFVTTNNIHLRMGYWFVCTVCAPVRWVQNGKW